MKLEQMTVEELSALTASDAPAPGGGAISAMSGAFAAALASMVAGLTIGRKKYADVQAEMEAAAREANEIRVRLLTAMDEDVAAFDAVMAALGMPKSTDAEKSARSAQLQKALKRAALAPLETARIAARVLPIARQVVGFGNRNAVTDGLCAAMMARTAVLGALYNVKVNLGSIDDAEFVEKALAESRALEAEAVRLEAEALALAPELR